MSYNRLQIDIIIKSIFCLAFEEMMMIRMGDRSLFEILNTINHSLNNFRRFLVTFLWVLNNLNFFFEWGNSCMFFTSSFFFVGLFDDDDIKQTNRLISTIEQSKYTHIMCFTSKGKHSTHSTRALTM